MTYFSDPNASTKHLVRFYYADKEDMFDLVSYQKGGRVLNMLRNFVGDSAFFKGLNLYLTTNKFKTGEAHQLRLALEEVSGKDLNWFFNQWYFGSGQPRVNIRYSYNESVKKAEVSIQQVQAGQIFKIPLIIDVYNGTAKVSHSVWINKAEETFIFDVPSKPDLINVDASKVILWEKRDDKTIDNYIFQYNHAGNYMDRREAIDACVAQKDNSAALNFLKIAVLDKYDGLRNTVLEGIDLKNEEMKTQFEPILVSLAKTDKKSTVRANALELLADYKKKEYKDLFVANLYDSSYSVAGAALGGLAKIDSVAGLAEAKKQMKAPSQGDLAEAISDILIMLGTEADFDYVAEKYEKMPLSQSKFGATMGFEKFLEKVKDTNKVKKGVDLIVDFREAIPKPYRDQTDPTINGLILSNLLKKKETDGMQDQAEYIKSKLPK
jgi:aminopeptidase N